MLRKLRKDQISALIFRSSPLDNGPQVLTNWLEVERLPKGTIVVVQDNTTTKYLMEFTDPQHFKARVFQTITDGSMRHVARGIQNMPSIIRIGKGAPFLVHPEVRITWIEILKVPFDVMRSKKTAKA